MKTPNSLIADVFFLLLGLFGIISSLTFRFWESMVLPLAASTVIFVLALAEVVKNLRRRRSVAAADTDGTSEALVDRTELKKLAVLFTWTVGFFLATYVFGYYIAIPLFAFAYVKWTGKGWLAALIFAVVSLAFVYGVFELGLKTPLFKGIIFGAR